MTITGKFDTNNAFKVQVRKNQYEPEIGEFPAILNDGKIEVTFTDPNLSTFSDLQLRVLSTAPATASQYASGSFRVYSKGNLSISNYLADTINKYEPLSLAFSGKSNSPGVITLQDSTRFDFFGNAGSPSLNFNRQFYPENSATYTIAHAENFCGAMTISGQAKAVINTVSVRTTQLSPLSLCPGSEIKVNFSTDGTIPSSAKYRIRLLEARDPGDMPKAFKFELTATLKDGALYATIPDNLNIDKSTYFFANVLVTQPAIVGSYADLTVLISPKATAEVISQNVDLEMGNYVGIRVRYKGPSPYTINLSDGSKIVWTDMVPTYKDHEFTRTPISTTDYTVKSIESGCKQDQLSGKAMRVTVKPGFYLDQVNIEKNYCEGETVRLHFISNGSISASTLFNLEIGFQGKTVSVPAKREGEFVEFKIPSIINNPGQTYVRNKSFSFVLSSVNPSLQSFRIDGITIQTKPTIEWSKSNSTSFTGPATTTQSFFLLGGGPYDVTFKNGQTERYSIYDVFASARFYVPASGSFGIRSISNACFSNTDLPMTDLKVDNPGSTAPLISAIVDNYNMCYTDSLGIDINVSGKFDPGNTFEIQMTDGVSSYTFKTFAKVNGAGKVKVRIPPDGIFKLSSGTASIYLRLVSTSPVIYSEIFGVSLNYPLDKISLAYAERVNYVDIKERPNTAQINYLGSVASSLVYSDGTVDRTVALPGSVYNSVFALNSTTGKNTYTLKTITSVCGIQALNLPMSVVVLPYRIRVPDTYGYPSICAGSSITIPFVILDAVPGTTSFSLQILKKDKSDYLEIGKGTSMKEITGIIPADFPPGAYIDLRIVSSEGIISSNTMSAQIGAAPTGNITAKDRTDTGPITVAAGVSVNLQVSLTGSMPQWVVADGLYEYNRESSPFTYSVSPLKSNKYVIKSIRNACGYGTASGSVEVKVMPTLTANISNYIQCVGSAVPLNYSLNGEFDLSNDYIRFDLVDQRTQKKYSLDSTKVADGQKLIQIPATVPGGNYNLITNVRKYGLKINSFIQLMVVPNVTLLGSTIINPGEQTNLLVKHNGFINAQPTSYQLSNGYRGQFSEANPAGASVTVSPTTTSEYTITDVSNQCGTGIFSGKAIVQVNPVSERTVTVTNWKSVRSLSALCIQDSILVHFSSTGIFSEQNRFTTQISDSTGRNFLSIPTSGISSPLIAVIPGTLPRGSGYRLRIIATDPGTGGGAFKDPLDLKSKASARFSTGVVTYLSDATPKAVVLLEGDSPYTYVYGTDIARQNKYAVLSIDSLILYQASPSISYKLFSVNNVCGAGVIGTPSTVRVELVTGVEDPANQMQVTIMPNPTSNFVKLKFSSAGPRKATIYSIDGKLWLHKSIMLSEEIIDFQNMPLGVFILYIDSNKLRRSYKILRQ